MSTTASFICAILSAVALSAGIPNELLKTGSSLFGLVALVPLYLALKNAKSWRAAGLLGGTMMMLVHLISSFWLAYFREFAIFTLGASTVAYFFIGIVAGWILRRAILFPENVRPFIFAAVWTVWEWFKSIGFLAYPWGTLVMTSRELVHLIQIADITGTWGITYLLALIPAVLAEGILFFQESRRTGNMPVSPAAFCRTPFFRAAAFSAALVTLATGYGIVRIATLPSPVTSLEAVIVQQNVDSWEDGGTKKAMLVSERLTMDALRESGKKADLVIWSESVLGWPYLQNKDYYARIPKEYPLPEFLADSGAPLLVGSPVLVDPVTDGYSNSVILLSPEGEQLDWHAKVQLVCFAEYMPFTEYEWVRTFFDKLVGFSRGWVPGTDVSPMMVTNGEGINIGVATPICFEDAFPALNARMRNAGSDVIVNLTNDAWSKTDSAELQHFVIASFRSIELRTTMVRSTNGGYSVVLDPTGKILADMPLFTAAARLVSVPVYLHTTTFYARFGDWFPSLMAILVLIASVASIVLDRKHGKR